MLPPVWDGATGAAVDAATRGGLAGSCMGDDSAARLIDLWRASLTSCWKGCGWWIRALGSSCSGKYPLKHRLAHVFTMPKLTAQLTQAVPRELTVALEEC